MIKCNFKDCGKKLKWKGKGRKPKWCDVHKLARKRQQNSSLALREDRHARNLSATRFDELWLVHEWVYDEQLGETTLTSRPVPRDPTQVWNATGMNDDEVINRSGVFHKTGPDGLPDLGHSVPTTVEYGEIRWVMSETERLAQGKLDPDGDASDPRLVEARSWLRDNPGWWRFTSDDEERPANSPADEHLHFSKDIRDTAVVHGGSYVDAPDESTSNDKCSFCGEKMELLWGHMFCSEECAKDYVCTFGDVP